MKIKSIDIAAFGKFKNYHLDLDDGFTMILGENEKGKTTIMSFIRMMFYGNSGKTSDAEKNPRIKYRPWNSDIMAGSITFTHNRTNYRLEREFKKSNSADKITLINLDLGTTQTLSGSDVPGATFFGLTDAAFERSVFIGGLDAPAKNDVADGEINSRLSNIAVTGDQDISYEAVKLRLQKAREELLSRGGKKGKLDKTALELEDIQKEINAARQTEENIAVIRQQIALKEAEIEVDAQESARLFGQLKDADRLKKRIFVERYIAAEKELADVRQGLCLKNGNYADGVFLADAKSLYGAYLNAEEKAQSLGTELTRQKDELDALIKQVESAQITVDGKARLLGDKCDDIDSKIEVIKGDLDFLNNKIKALKPEKKINLPLTIVGLTLSLIGAGLFFLNLYIALGLLGAGIILLVLGLIIKKNILPDDSVIQAQIQENSRKLTDLLESKQNLLKEISLLNQKENDNKIKVAADKAVLESKNRQVSLCEKEYQTARVVSKSAKNALLEHLGVLYITAEEEKLGEIISGLEEKLRTAENIMQKIALLADHANCSSVAEAEEKLESYNIAGVTESVTEQEVDDLKERFKLQSEITGKKRSELSALKVELKTLCDSCPSLAVLNRKKEELSQKIQNYKYYCDSIDIAAEALDEAFCELRKNYSSALDTETGKIFLSLAGDKYKSVSVSKNFDLNVTTEEAFGLKSSAYLSSGTEDQLYLALRLAITKLITADSEALTIFMDDPLDQFDDIRAEKAIEFLKDYSADKQIIMFTCHSAFADMARNNGINIQEI